MTPRRAVLAHRRGKRRKSFLTAPKSFANFFAMLYNTITVNPRGRPIDEKERCLVPKFLKKIDRETMLYVLFGTLTAIVNLSVYFVLNWAFDVNYMVSNITAWVVTVLFAYVTNKLFVFRTKTGSWKELGREFVRFVNSRIISGGADQALMWLLVGLFHFNSSLIKMVNSGVVVVLNYILSKLMIFKPREDRAG